MFPQNLQSEGGRENVQLSKEHLEGINEDKMILGFFRSLSLFLLTHTHIHMYMQRPEASIGYSMVSLFAFSPSNRISY